MHATPLVPVPQPFSTGAVPGEWVEVGIVAWGYGDAPNVYTRVSAFREWIDSIVQARGSSSTSEGGQ